MKKSLFTLCALLLSAFVVPLSAAPPDDLTVTKKMTVNGAEFSTQSLLKGARERSTMQMNGTVISTNIRQCDLHRTLTVQDSTKSFLVRPDIENSADTKEAKDAKEAKDKSAGSDNASTGGVITYRSTIKDLGERKQILGYNARHLKMTIVSEPSESACSKAKTNYEIDGWYIELKTVPGASCQSFSSAMASAGDTATSGCMDKIIYKQSGSIKPGYPVQETMTIQQENAQPFTISTEVTDIQKTPLDAALFDVPADYRQVSTIAELRGVPANMPAPPQQQAQYAQAYQGQAQQPMPQQPQQMKPPNPLLMMNPVTGPAAAMAYQQQAMAQQQQMMAQAQAAGYGQGMLMPGMPNQPVGQQVAAPQALGPKQPGKIRIGVATPDAQMGQGTNANQDYATPVRNAMIQLMSGPAVEIAAIGSRIPIQIQAEAQQKQCDYVLYSSVVVKHAAKGGFGNFMKMAAPVANMAPMMGGGMNGAMAGAVASQAASVAAQQAAANQLGQFNGQIKSKDDVTVQYQLVAPGQTNPKTQSTLQGKAKSDGEDVMTPLLTQLATAVLTESLKK